jgi:hypothetical protein
MKTANLIACIPLLPRTDNCPPTDTDFFRTPNGAR